MKRYMLFVFRIEDPMGGADDFSGWYDTVWEAITACGTILRRETIHIVDVERGRLLKTNGGVRGLRNTDVESEDNWLWL